MAETGKSEGVPKETGERNSLEQLRRDLTAAISATAAARFVSDLLADGYFDKSLLEQKGAIVEGLAALPAGQKVLNALLRSRSDKVRSYGVSLSGHVFRSAPVRQLALLKKAGALPGTWTQETAQTELKNVVHREGLHSILPRIAGWATDGKPEVRRMMIEALRPRGVWCQHLEELKHDPAPLQPLLEQLLDDTSLYVRKAVANNLNDIAKENPATLCKWVKQWQQGKISAERQWIIKRGLRSLLRDGYPAALKLMGYGSSSGLRIVWKKDTPKRIKIGDQIPFEFEVANQARTPALLRLQLEMHAPGKNNKPRVSRYLLADARIAAGKSRTLTKKIKFEHKNSVPRLPGEYRLAISVNGQHLAERSTTYRL